MQRWCDVCGADTVSTVVPPRPSGRRIPSYPETTQKVVRPVGLAGHRHTALRNREWKMKPSGYGRTGTVIFTQKPDVAVFNKQSEAREWQLIFETGVLGRAVAERCQ